MYLVHIEDITIIKRIKVYALDLSVFRVTLISVSGVARCPTIRPRQLWFAMANHHWFAI